MTQQLNSHSYHSFNLHTEKKLTHKRKSFESASRFVSSLSSSSSNTEIEQLQPFKLSLFWVLPPFTFLPFPSSCYCFGVFFLRWFYCVCLFTGDPINQRSHGWCVFVCTLWALRALLFINHKKKYNKQSLLISDLCLFIYSFISVTLIHSL